MKPEPSSELTPDALIALRLEADAVRAITDRLKVKEMGPADHIRTKHEVKAFVESGDSAMAQPLLNRARERRKLSQSLTINVKQSRGQQI